MDTGPINGRILFMIKNRADGTIYVGDFSKDIAIGKGKAKW